MRVLQINAIDDILSTGTIMSDIQDVCTHNGIECHIAYPVTIRSKRDILHGYHIGCWFDHKLHALLSRIFRKQAYFSTIPTWFLLRHINRIRPNVVHLHNLHSNYINLNMLLQYLAKRQIATIATLHDNWFYTGGCTYYPRLNCTRWLTDCKGCPQHKHGFVRFLPDTASCILDDRDRYLNSIPCLTIVGVSDWISDECRKSRIGRNPIITIRNGVRNDVFQPMPLEARQQLRAKYGLRPDQFVILGPASKWLNHRNRTGLRTMLHSLQPDELLVLYGCSPQQMADTQITALSSQLVLLPFYHNKVELSTIYCMADVMINCTYEDTCSFLNLECQASGTPIITFDNTGARECVDTICSFRTPTGDYQAMYRKVQEIKQQVTPQNPRPFQQACVSWIEHNFTMQINYKQYVQLYKELGQKGTVRL